MIELECDNCGKINKINDYEIENIGTNMRKMGAEVEYGCCVEVECEKCNQNLSAEFKAWEYPVGCLNGTDQFSDGCEINSEPDLSSRITLS